MPNLLSFVRLHSQEKQQVLCLSADPFVESNKQILIDLERFPWDFSAMMKAVTIRT